MEQEKSIPEFNIEALQSGDERAFSAVYNQFYQALCFFAEQITKDHFGAKEVVQDVFVKLWQRENAGSEIQNIKSYLYAATRNGCLNYIDAAQRRNRRNEEFGNLTEADEDEILQNIIRAEVMREIALAIEQLPTQCRKVVQMTFQEGKSPNEIADTLGVSVSTVRNQKARGVGLLKKLLSHSSFMALLSILG